MTWRRVGVMAVLVAAGACAGSGTPAADPVPVPSATPTLELTGTVRVSGPEGMVIASLNTDSGSYAIAGELQMQFRVLGTATVRVIGSMPPAAGGGRAFMVRDFDVLRVGNMEAVSGFLGRRGDGWVVRTGAGPRMLSDAPEGLREMEGAKVWVAGRDQAGAFVVARFGLIHR